MATVPSLSRCWILVISLLCLARHPAFVSAFATPGAWVRSCIGKSPIILRAGMDEKDALKPAMGEEESPIEEANGDDPDVDCDLAAQLELELAEGYARRNPEPVPKETGYWEAFFGAALDLVFVRRANSERMRKMFLTKRSYAKNETFTRSAFGSPPVVEDLLPYPTLIKDSFYLSVPAAVLTFVVSSAIFPVMANFLVDFIDIPPGNLEDINSKLVPGISILYGTFMSLTLSILYNRQRQVQDSVAQETSLLSFLLYNLVTLFRRDRNRMVRAGQCAADQVRILLRENRGIEYMNLIYTDPYMRMLKIVEEEEERLILEEGSFGSKGVRSSIVCPRPSSGVNSRSFAV